MSDRRRSGARHRVGGLSETQRVEAGLGGAGEGKSSDPASAAVRAAEARLERPLPGASAYPHVVDWENEWETAGVREDGAYSSADEDEDAEEEAMLAAQTNDALLALGLSAEAVAALQSGAGPDAAVLAAGEEVWDGLAVATAESLERADDALGASDGVPPSAFREMARRSAREGEVCARRSAGGGSGDGVGKRGARSAG